MTGSLVPRHQLLKQVASNWIEMDASKLPHTLTHAQGLPLLDPAPLLPDFTQSLSLPNTRQALL